MGTSKNKNVGWVEAALAHPCASRHLGFLPFAERNPPNNMILLGPRAGARLTQPT